MSPGIRVLLTLTELDRLAPLPCMDVCPVCGSDQVHGQACIATRLFRTIARLGNRGLRVAEIPVVEDAFPKHVALHHRRGMLGHCEKKIRRSKERRGYKSSVISPMWR
jgi:hypothetical protein